MVNYSRYCCLARALVVQRNCMKILSQSWLVMVMSREPTVQELHVFNKTTYILIKKNEWGLYFYEHGKRAEKVDLDQVGGFEAALAKLPKKTPEQLTDSEIRPVQEAISAYHQGMGGGLGKGNGWIISRDINFYMVQFFDTFLKEKETQAFHNCTRFTPTSMIWCGPAVYRSSY